MAGVRTMAMKSAITRAYTRSAISWRSGVQVPSRHRADRHCATASVQQVQEGVPRPRVLSERDVSAVRFRFSGPAAMEPGPMIRLWLGDPEP